MDIKLFDTPPFLSFNLSITRILFHYFRTTNINHRLRYREILMLTFYEMSILQVGTEHFLFGDISVVTSSATPQRTKSKKRIPSCAISKRLSIRNACTWLHFLI